MNKMAKDTFSTFLLYLVENLPEMVCFREQGQSRCRFADTGWGERVFSALLWRNSPNTNMFDTQRGANIEIFKSVQNTFNGGEYFCAAYEYE